MTNNTITHAWRKFIYMTLYSVRHITDFLGTLSTILRDNYKQWNHQQKKFKNVKNPALNRLQKRHLQYENWKKKLEYQLVHRKLGGCMSDDSNFSLLCACLWMTITALCCFWSYKINFIKQANLKIQNTWVIRIN